MAVEEEVKMNFSYGRTSGMVSAAALAMMLAQPSFAQNGRAEPASVAQADPVETQGPQGADIVVTAQRRSQRLFDVGLSVAAVGADTLKERNVLAVDDLGKLVPGLSVSNSGYSLPIYTLRGVGVNEFSLASNSSIAIYVDEVPLTYPITTQGAVFDLERVEVLKGPQGTLYGQNSTGGAINYIAKKPTNEFAAGFTGTFGRFNRGVAEGYVSGPLSSTLKSRIALRAERGGDWQRSITRNDSLGRLERYTGRAIVEWQPTSDFKLTLNANGFIDKSDTLAAQLVKIVPSNPALLLPVVANSPLAGDNARDADWNPNRNLARDDKFGQVSLRADYTVSDNATLTLISAYAEMSRKQNSDLDGMAQPTAEYIQTGHIRAISNEFRGSLGFGKAKLIVGANMTDDRVADRVRTDFSRASTGQNIAGFPVNGATIDTLTRVHSWSIFANVDIPILERLTLGGGIRYGRETRRFSNCSEVYDAASSAGFTSLVNTFRSRAGLAPVGPIGADQCYSMYLTTVGLAKDTGGAQLFVPGFANRVYKEKDVPWNVSLTYKIDRDAMVYARVSRGYKSGNFAAIGNFSNDFFDAIPKEQLTAYELGGRVRPAPNIQLEAAVFSYSYKDKQLRARVNVGPPFGTINAQAAIPRSRLQGIEASIAVRVMEGLNVGVNGTYIDTKVQEYTGQSVIGGTFDFNGAEFNFTPKFSVNGDINYKAPVSANLSIFTGLNVSYRSSTQAVFVPPTANKTLFDPFKIRAYTLVDGRFGIEGRSGWQAYIWGKNIFNTFYTTNAVQISDQISRFAGEPATYGVTFSVKY